MNKDIISYRQERLDNYHWLTMMGTCLWDIPIETSLSVPHSSDKIPTTIRLSEEQVLDQMNSFLGRPSLEVVRYLWQRFSTDFPGIGAVSGLFYYHYKGQENPEINVRKDAVVFPAEVALDPSLLSWEWIETKQQKLENTWNLKPVHFAVNGGVLTPFEYELLENGYHETGDLGEYWYRGTHNIGLISKPEYFMTFADIDSQVSDQELLKISGKLGSPFWVSKTTRGHHLIFPIKFKTFSGPITRDEEIRARLGLIRGGLVDSRNLFRWELTAENAIRVTSDSDKHSVPKITAVVWDGNTIVKW